MNFSYSTCRPKSPSIICLDFNLRHAYTHTHARSLCETHKKCCIANRRSAKRAQGAFDKPKQHNAQRIATCRVMSRHVDGAFYATPPPLQLATAFNLCACSLSLCLSGCDLSGNKRKKYQQLPLFLSRPHASNDINFRLTALQRVYLFYNNKQRGVGGRGRVLGTITLNTNAEQHPSVRRRLLLPSKMSLQGGRLLSAYSAYVCGSVLSVCSCVCVCYA